MNHANWTVSQRALWMGLEQLDPDQPYDPTHPERAPLPPATLSFTHRLARENGWGLLFAQRVVDEYKRFLFLASEAGHPVTPSEEVDQAWHLHLAYTRSYWDDLCGHILGRPLHHGPTRGGEAEGAKFNDWYQRTRESYALFFGDVPPSDIWPEPDIRFGEAEHYLRVNTARNFVIPKRAVGRRAVLAGLGLSVMALGGCGLLLAQQSSASPLAGWVLGATLLTALVVLLIVLVGIFRANRGNPTQDSTSSTGCSGFLWWGGTGTSGCGSDKNTAGEANDGGSGCGASDSGASSGSGGDGGGGGGGGDGGGGGCGGGCGS